MVSLKKIVGFLVIALLIFFVITQPTAAASVLQSIGTTLRNAGNAVITFFTSLV